MIAESERKVNLCFPSQKLDSKTFLCPIYFSCFKSMFMDQKVHTKSTSNKKNNHVIQEIFIFGQSMGKNIIFQPIASSS